MSQFEQTLDSASHPPCMLSICPSFSAAPRTRQSVLTILSAFASVKKGLASTIPPVNSKIKSRKKGGQIIKTAGLC